MRYDSQLRSSTSNVVRISRNSPFPQVEGKLSRVIPLCFQTPFPMGALPFVHLLSSKSGRCQFSIPAGSVMSRNRLSVILLQLVLLLVASTAAKRQIRSSGRGLPTGFQ
jgi:hypothetical protein